MTCAMLVNRCYEQAKSKLPLMNGQYPILHSATGSRVPYLTRLPTKVNCWKLVRLLTIIVRATASIPGHRPNTYIPIPAAHET